MFFSSSVPASLLAEGEQQQPGGFNPMMIVLLVMVVLLVFMMFRNRKRQQQQQAERGTKLIPGAKVMTSAGIFGTIVSANLDENKVVLETAPGQTMTVHVQAITTFVDDAKPAAAVEETQPAAGEEDSLEERMRRQERDGEDGPGPDSL